MVWANSILLAAGALLLAVPVVLHFMMQSKPKNMVFPALRFIKERQQRSQSRMRLRHIVLLLLRCLLIGLLAAALAGPSVASREFGNWLTLGGVSISALLLAGLLALVWFGKRKTNMVLVSVLGVLLLGHLAFIGWSAVKLASSESTQLLGDSSAPVAALILVDTSPRMEYIHENQTLLERAKETGDWVIGQLPLDSQVSVLATDRDKPFFSVDISAAKKRLSSQEISYNAGFIPSTLIDGLKMLQKSELTRREVYVLTDMTARSWAGEGGDKISKLLNEDESISVFVFDVGPKSVSNFSLTPVRLSDSVVPVSSSVAIQSQLQRIGDPAERTVRLRVEKPDPSRPVIRDGKTLVNEQYWEQTASVAVDSETSAGISFTFSEPIPIGVHHGRLELIGEDGLNIDNTRYFTVEVKQAFEALVVHGRDVSPENFVVTMSNLFDCTTVSQREMKNFDGYQVVCFLDPGPISKSTWVTMEKYVRNGGSVLFFLGKNASRKGFGDESFGTPEAQRILSGKLTRQWRRPDSDLFLSPDNLTHPIFEKFRSIATSVPWTNHPVFLHWQIEPEENVPDEELLPTQTVLRFSNGRPALIERTIGDGRVLVMTTSITEPSGKGRWNDLFSLKPWPAWMLVNGIAKHAVKGESTTLNVSVGQPVVMRNDLDKYPEDYQMFTPDLEQRPTKLTSIDGRIRYKFTDMPGHFRMKGKLVGPVVRGFSSNLLEADTDMKRILPDALDQSLGAERYELATEKTEIQRQQGTTRRGQEFYPFLLLMLLIILAVEHLMSNRFYAPTA